jgi:hypothetical protein
MTFINSWAGQLAIAIIVFFVHEFGSIIQRKNMSGTLTVFVRSSTKRYPLLIFVLGMLTGGAAFHFWGGGLCG